MRRRRRGLRLREVLALYLGSAPQLTLLFPSVP